ncbi:cytochrome-c peroxidase [Omnitrophica bacterium]|nr:cytochrome-c peroxidase [Candidatus Omnitrophota bacterium]
MKFSPLGFIVLLCLGLAFPVINYVVDSRRPTPIADAIQDNPAYERAARILEKKCVHCHLEGKELPFYGDWPVAKNLIQHDIEEGMEHFRLESVLKPKGGEVSEVTLAKLEDVVEKSRMPLMRYAVLHWYNLLLPRDKAVILDWIGMERSNRFASDNVALPFRGNVIQPIPQSVHVDPRKVELGEKLFHDKRLSADNTISCATCHDLEMGGTDQQPTSTGIHDAVGPINAPTVYNAVFQFKQFWDGRSTDLKDQAAGPVLNPIEMGSNWEEVVPKLQADAELTQAFTEVYPEGWSGDTITDAIAEFEKTLITPDSAFDHFLRGEKTALTEQELAGYRLFKAYSCTTCHVGKILGGQSFEKLGRGGRDYFADRGTEVREADLGRFNVTKDEDDRYKFKVPTLRNIEVTHPYFHDGSVKDMESAVRKMAYYQDGKDLSVKDTDDIVAFLKSLTGTYKGKKLS